MYASFSNVLIGPCIRSVISLRFHAILIAMHCRLVAERSRKSCTFLNNILSQNENLMKTGNFS